MLSSSGFFSDIICPFFKGGLCERPHCHFKHVLEPPKAPRPSVSSCSPQQSASSSQKSSYTPTPAHKLKKSVSMSTEKTGDSETSAFPAYKPTPISELKKLKDETTKRKLEDSPERVEKRAKKEKRKSSSDRKSNRKSSSEETSSKSDNDKKSPKRPQKSSSFTDDDALFTPDACISPTPKTVKLTQPCSTDSSSKKRVAHVVSESTVSTSQFFRLSKSLSNILIAGHKDLNSRKEALDRNRSNV